MSGRLILRDVYKEKLTVNGVEMPIEGGFRGLKNVPPGTHKFELAHPCGPVKFEASVAPATAVVLVMDEEKMQMVPDTEHGARFTGMAMSGAMDHVLLPFPNEAAGN